MAPALPHRASIASLCVVSLALAPLVLRAQSASRPTPAPQVVVLQVPSTSQRTCTPSSDPAPGAANVLRIRWGANWYPATRLRVVWGPYALYRFDNYGAEWDSIVHERDVRDASAVTPPWQDPTPGLPMPERHRITRGERLLGEWQGSWYAVRVLAARADGGARVRYEGYGPEWDENLSRARLRLQDPETNGPAPAPPSLERLDPADPQNPPAIGQLVVVRQGPSHKVARVLSADGPVYWVHYLGHSRAFDEPVLLDRVLVHQQPTR